MAVKEKVGVVVSDKMQKTVVVAVENRTSHPKYGKIVVKTTKFKAHDEEDKTREGDRVKFGKPVPSAVQSDGKLSRFSHLARKHKP